MTHQSMVKATMMHRILPAAGKLSAQAAGLRMACDADLLPTPEEESFVMCSSTQLGLRMRLSKAATKFLWNLRFSVDGSPAAAMQPLMLLHFVTHKTTVPAPTWQVGSPYFRQWCFTSIAPELGPTVWTPPAPQCSCLIHSTAACMGENPPSGRSLVKHSHAAAAPAPSPRAPAPRYLTSNSGVRKPQLGTYTEPLAVRKACLAIMPFRSLTSDIYGHWIRAALLQPTVVYFFNQHGVDHMRLSA